MTGGMPLWGWAALAVCTIAALLAGMWIGYGRGFGHAAEEAEWQREDARWKGLADAASRPVPVRQPAPPEASHAGPGKHRHPAGPRHAQEQERPALPTAGYLPALAVPGAWNGQITVPAPAQAPPWDTRPPEPQTEVLEPTAVLSGPGPDPCTDSAWTRRMAADMDAWIAEHITATDSVLKEITGGAR